MPVNSPEEIKVRLAELARFRQVVELKCQPAEAEAARLTAEAKRWREEAASLEKSLREDVLEYMRATGDLHVDEHLSFRRTTRLVYDPEEVVAILDERNREDLLRRSLKLDVRAFEKAFKDGEFPDLNVEQVNAPTLEIRALGDLLWEQADGES